MLSALIYYGIRYDSSCTNTMSSTKSKRSLDSNNSVTKSMFLPSNQNFATTIKK